MFKILNQPFPLAVKIESRVIALTFGAFVFLFLFIFRPFGLQHFETKRLAFAAFYYGLICFVVLILCLILIRKLTPSLFEENKWTVWKDILHNGWLTLVGATANIIFTHYYFDVPINATMIIKFFWITLSIVIIPISIMVLLKQIHLMKTFSRQADELDRQLQSKEASTSRAKPTDNNGPLGTQPKPSDLVNLVSDNEKENFTIPPDQFLYAEAADNYVRVFYLSGKKSAQKILRSSMKKVQENLQGHFQFYRCHRAYIVNLQKVIHVSGNAQGYKLQLEAVEELIPVSRSLNKKITEKLSDL
jgi:hypothetical protein